MAVKLSPIWVGTQFLTAAGLPLSGGKILQYTAGTTTPTATYTDSTGVTPNANPIILDSTGRYSSQIWFTSGVNYKLMLQDSGGNTLLTEDSLTGVNDSASSTPSEWVVSGLVPTFISTAQFSLAGNQTTNFQVGRRLQITVNAGIIYATITASVFTSLTTITVAIDSGVLDVGISVVNYSLLGESNPSVPASIAYPLTLSTISGNPNFTGSPTVVGNINSVSVRNPRASTVASVSFNNVATVYITPAFSVAANSLAVGDSVRITLIGRCTTSAANTTTISFVVGSAGTIADAAMFSISMTANTVGTGTPFRLCAEGTISAIGSSGGCGGYITVLNSLATAGISTQVVTISNLVSGTPNTTGTLFFGMTGVTSAGTTSVTIYQAIVEYVR